MPSPYQEFAAKAKARFLERQKRMASGGGDYTFTEHAQYKMQQYGLSEQKVKSVIRNPRRREEGIMPNTVAVMQPPSVKRDATGKESWSQEIWVMFKTKSQTSQPSSIEWKKSSHQSSRSPRIVFTKQLRIISAWRYPGVSPKRSPIPEEILRELEEEHILEEEIFL